MSLARRALWHINRSPLKHGVKALATVRHLAEKRERRRLLSQVHITSGLQRKADELRVNGYVRLDDVVHRTFLESMADDAAGKFRRLSELERRQTLKHKDFWVSLLDEDKRGGAFDVDSVYVRYALQPAVIGLLGAYYGELPILDYVLLTLSRESKSELKYSQLWHRDHDDIRTIKLFAYLTDVRDLADGPFTFLPGPVSDRFGFSLRSHVGDSRIFPRAERSEVLEMMGPRLSTFMVETSRCLHMGSRMGPGHTRLLYTATFISAPRIFPSSGPKFRSSRPIGILEHKLLDF